MPTSRKKAERHQKGKAPPNKVAEIRGSRKDSSRDAGTRVSFPIVAIGASAGGLEAFSNLLRALPEDPGLALVFIPHLDPTHESAMVELLARTTQLSVYQAAEGMRVQPNNVYVLPPNCDMTISDGVLHLAERAGGRGHHLPIDSFFRSLAEDQASNAIGVILSGTANDGTLGLSAIKSSGGMTFAQDYESAKYDGMPRSAVEAGVADYVLPPYRIAEELARIQRGSNAALSSDESFEGKDPLLKEIFRRLKSFSKVDFIDYKVATIRRRILRRMSINHITELSDYVKLLQGSPQEVESLYRDVLIN